MLKIISKDKQKSALFQSHLGSIISECIPVNMGGKLSSSILAINSYAPVSFLNNRDVCHNIISGIAPYPKYSRDEYPIVIKSLRKNRDSVVVDDAKEQRIFQNMFAEGYILQNIFKPTSEYLICASNEEVFFSFKLHRRKGFEDRIIMPFNGYRLASDFLKPKLWEKMKADTLTVIKSFNLDFGMAKFSYNSTGDVHKYVPHSIKTELPFDLNLIEPFKQVLLKKIDSKLKTLNKIKENVTKVESIPC